MKNADAMLKDAGASVKRFRGYPPAGSSGAGREYIPEVRGCCAGYCRQVNDIYRELALETSGERLLDMIHGSRPPEGLGNSWQSGRNRVQRPFREDVDMRTYTEMVQGQQSQAHTEEHSTA